MTGLSKWRLQLRWSCCYHTVICHLSDGERKSWMLTTSRWQSSYQIKMRLVWQPLLLPTDISGPVPSAATVINYQASHRSGSDALLKYVKMWDCHARISSKSVKWTSWFATTTSANWSQLFSACFLFFSACLKHSYKHVTWTSIPTRLRTPCTSTWAHRTRSSLLVASGSFTRQRRGHIRVLWQRLSPACVLCLVLLHQFKKQFGKVIISHVAVKMKTLRAVVYAGILVASVI